MSKASELFAHAQRFVREVFAERLKEESFASTDPISVFAHFSEFRNSFCKSK